MGRRRGAKLAFTGPAKRGDFEEVSESAVQTYYDHDGVTIYNADCRDVLPVLKRKSIDLVLTDPPFFMPAVHYQSRNMQQRSWGDTSALATFWANVLDLCVPLLKPTGHFVAFCDGDSYPVFYPEMYRRFHAIKTLVWNKQHFGMGRVWRNQHELVIAARWDTAEFPNESSRSDILDCKPTPSEKRLHPVEKPAKLLEQLIIPTTGDDALILDPFGGSCTTAVAARNLGRRCIVCETETPYCEVGVKRLSQKALFAALDEGETNRPRGDKAECEFCGDPATRVEQFDRPVHVCGECSAR